MQLFIGRAKGKKDRCVGLSPVLLDAPRSYLRSCKSRPVKYLFEGCRERPIPQRVRRRSSRRPNSGAGILKKVSFQALCHSFATHLLEKDMDNRYIKDLQGHFSSKTTERYLLVKRGPLINIASPLDGLWTRQRLEW